MGTCCFHNVTDPRWEAAWQGTEDGHPITTGTMSAACVELHFEDRLLSYIRPLTHTQGS